MVSHEGINGIIHHIPKWHKAEKRPHTHWMTKLRPENKSLELAKSLKMNTLINTKYYN